jgi:hypothetical protein
VVGTRLTEPIERRRLEQGREGQPFRQGHRAETRIGGEGGLTGGDVTTDNLLHMPVLAQSIEGLQKCEHCG